MRSRRRPVDERQLVLADWSPKECQSPLHRGNRLTPLDQFVRNGRYLRTCCRSCWAELNRGKRYEEPGNTESDRELRAKLNRLWRA